MSNKVTVSLLTLPVELIYHILDYVDIFTIEISFRNVCTRLKTIADAYRQCQTRRTPLVEIRLTEQKLSNQELKYLADALHYNTTLTTLVLQSNEIGIQGAKYLADMLQTNTTLITLSLGDNRIGNQGAAYLAEGLENNSTLAHMSLWFNKIGDYGIRHLAKALQYNTTLTRLNLWGNEIGDQGLQHLADTLRTNTTLTNINLFGNQIGEKGAKYLASILQNNTTLITMSLGANLIKDQGLNYLEDAIRKQRMQSSNNTSPLLNHAIKIREKNVELRKKITELQHDVQLIEQDISTLTNTYDELAEQCQILRENQTDKKKDLLLEEYQKQFNDIIHDIENYINMKQWNISPNEKTTPLSPKPSSSVESDNKIEEIPIQTLNEDLNQQLASVENWLMESAVTDIDKQSPVIAENQHTDDETDDLYKDLIFPPLSDDLPTQSEEIKFDENNHREECIKNISPENSKREQQQRPDKNQRRFALMRQLAEKSNKTVTRKLI